MKKLNTTEISMIHGGGFLKCGAAVTGTVFFGTTAALSMFGAVSINIIPATYKTYKHGIKIETGNAILWATGVASGYMALRSLGSIEDECLPS
jgi:hypothetical protein